MARRRGTSRPQGATAESKPGLNGSLSVELCERVAVLETTVSERQASLERWAGRIDERLAEGADRMDELGESTVRTEMALRSLSGLPARVASIEAAVSPLPSLMRTLETRVNEISRQWEPLRNKLYYAAAAGVGWLWLTGKLSDEQAGKLAKPLLGPLLGF